MTVMKQYTQGAGFQSAKAEALFASAPLQATEATGDTTFAFSPESLLYYCSSRLESIDTQIDRYFKDQQAKNRASKELSDVQGILGRASYQKAGGEMNAEDLLIHTSESNELLQLYRNAQTPEGKQAAAEAFKIRSGRDISDYANGGMVTPEQIDASKHNIAAHDASQWAHHIEDVKSKAAEISKSAELNMIQLQSLVSQRQLAVQLTTQLMQSVHESMKGIAANCRA
jgi:hypothetical protein